MNRGKWSNRKGESRQRAILGKTWRGMDFSWMCTSSWGSSRWASNIHCKRGKKNMLRTMLDGLFSPLARMNGEIPNPSWSSDSPVLCTPPRNHWSPVSGRAARECVFLNKSPRLLWWMQSRRALLSCAEPEHYSINKKGEENPGCLKVAVEWPLPSGRQKSRPRL